MSDERHDQNRPSGSGWKLRFSLRGMLVFVTVLALLLTAVFSVFPVVWGLITETETVRYQLILLSQQAAYWRLNVIPYVLVAGAGAFMLVGELKRARRRR